MSDLQIHQFLCLKDNYGCLIHDPESKRTAAIDAPEAAAVSRALTQKNWQLTDIFITHHHGDHTAGIAALKAETGCKVIGPEAEAARIFGLDATVKQGDTFGFGPDTVRVLETPGHTLGHVSYFFENARIAFVGDTLFSLGCGRVFEGTNQMMWQSLEKLSKLPTDTRIYCGHEYTAANAKFALAVEPGNKALQARAKEVESLRAEGKPTLPTTLAREFDTNPFLRPYSSEIRANVQMPAAPEWQVFAELRERKNKA